MTPREMFVGLLQDRGLKVKKTGRQWDGQCPNHDDRNPSLSIGEGDDCKLLLNCHAGCPVEAIMASVGRTMADLFPPNGRKGTGDRIGATYDYRDEEGELDYQVVRWSLKGFSQRRPDGRGGWIWNLEGVDRVPYRLPELIVSEGDMFVVEGEKDVDRLHALGLTATTNPGGVGKWRPQYNRWFEGRDVCILPDNDPPGRDHAQQVAAQLYGVAASVRILEPPGLPDKGDVSDWLDDDNTVHALRLLAKHAPLWQPGGAEEKERDVPSSTWHRVDIAAYVAGSHAEDTPSVLRRSDGVKLFYRGRVHSLYGEPEGLKTFVALAACCQELEAGNIVVYIDFEDSVRGIIGRLRALGISDEVLVSRFIYIRPAERLTEAVWEELNSLLPTATLAVIDGLTEALVLEGLNLVDNNDIAVFFERLPRPAARLGPAVLTLDHVGRDKEARGRFAIGAQAKLAGIDGAAYSIAVTKPFGRGRVGQADIRLTKDRLGYVSEHAEGEYRTIATVEAVSNFETVTITLQPPGEFVPTILMEKVADALQATPGMSQKQIRDTVSGNTDWKLKALHHLVARGYVTTEPGPRGAILHTLIHPYRDGDQLRPYRNVAPPDTSKDDLSRPVPDLSPGQVKVSTRPVPPYSKGTGRGLSEEMTFPTETEDRSDADDYEPDLDDLPDEEEVEWA